MGLAILRPMVAFTTALILLGMGTVSADTIRQEVLKQCQGRFKNMRLTEEEIKRVLNDHEVWLKTYLKFDTQQARSDLRKANLCGGDLSGPNLSGAILMYANLSGANLSYTNLSGAQLRGANLSGALLQSANLGGAQLSDANLSGAILAYANLRGAIFEPKNLPDTDDIAYAHDLSEMVFRSSPQALVKLHKALKEAGYYQQERMVTYAIQHNLTQRLLDGKNIASIFEAIFRYVFFDLTCRWGMAPSRALMILLALIPVFAFPYVIALHLPGKNGIWRKWADDRIRLDLGTKEPIRLYVGWFRASVLWFYFSVLSAFNFGWRELNVGNWIQRLQANEYTLKATGWVRTISGVQSLISVYLLAIWALTYFGRPFE